MDKNTLAGFGLLMLLLVGYIFYNQSAETKLKQKQTADSIAQAKLLPASPIVQKDSVVKDSLQTVPDSNRVLNVPAQETTIENEDLAITFTNKGGFPTKVFLKKFKTYDGKPLLLFDGPKITLTLDSNRLPVQ